MLHNHHKEVSDAALAIQNAKAHYLYNRDQWNIKQALQHVVDTEIILAYRALRFSRQDNTFLEGFDQIIYAKADATLQITLCTMKKEFECLQLSIDFFLANLTEQQLVYTGQVSRKVFYIKAFEFIIYGHKQHYIKIQRDRQGI